MEIVRINNPFQRQIRDVEIIKYSGKTLSELLFNHLATVNEKHGLTLNYDFAKDNINIIVNGAIIPVDYWHSIIPKEHHQIIFMPVVGKSGTVKTVASFAAIVSAFIILGPGAFGIGGLELGTVALFASVGAVISIFFN